jgi:RNA polymerase sigma-70 factor (ECF subfamily)
MMGPELLGRLLDKHSPALVLFARQWCAAPEDVVQEAFLKLARQKTELANPVSWLFRVVRNGALSAARSDRRRRRHEATAAGRAAPWLEPREPSELDAGTATAAMQTLPLDQREVIVAHLWGGLTFEEVGELAGCSSSTAHRRYLAGLAALREMLGEPCPSQDLTTISASWKRP